MVAANEIRIGNCFEHNNQWCYRSNKCNVGFTFKWDESDWYALGECTMFLENISPINLSGELLIKCGFEKIIGGDYIGSYQILFGKGTNANGLFLIVDVEDFNSVCIGQLKHFSHSFGEYKYLHQLQNLVYSISGKELEVPLDLK